MSPYESVQFALRTTPRSWLITGVAGFIGSNLLEALLKLDQRVIGLDNFATGHRRNLEEIRAVVTPAQWQRFNFVEGDIRNLEDCRRSCQDIDYVLHHAALSSVPCSVDDPITTNAANVDGFVNMLVAARDAQVKRFVFAASSATYGDHAGLPKVECEIGRPLSPYALTKFVNELYAEVFARCYGMETIGLRYFNVFGPRQDPNGAYAAVIPTWAAALLKSEPVFINGDGRTSRDFCYVANVVQANVLASTVQERLAINEVYNVAIGGHCTLNDLYALIRDGLVPYGVNPDARPSYRSYRAGDVRYSQADISKATRLLGYLPTHSLQEGLTAALAWYANQEWCRCP